MPKYTLGISKIELGNVANDGGPGTSLAVLGQTNQDSCKLNQADPEKTDFFAEEQDQPVYSTTKAGATTLTFQIMNPDTATLLAVFGGTVTGTSPAKTWNAPNSTATLEQTVKVTPKNGLILIIPRGLVTAKLNGEFSKKNLFVIDITVTALQPTKDGVGSTQMVE